MKMEKVLRSALLLLLAAALCLSMAACTQTPAESSPASETQTPETAASEKASTEDDMPEDAGTGETPTPFVSANFLWAVLLLFRSKSIIPHWLNLPTLHRVPRKSG